MSWESLPSTQVLSPAQRRDTGLSTLSEMETNMQRRAYSDNNMQNEWTLCCHAELPALWEGFTCITLALGGVELMLNGWVHE